MQNLQNRKFTQSYALKYFLMKYTFQFFDTLVNFFIKLIFTILINNMRGRKSFQIPKSPKDELYLQSLAMIEIDIEAVAGVEPHKEVPVAKLHKGVDLVKAQNTV